MMGQRLERDIFSDLTMLTATPGFAHIIAAFCTRDNFSRYRGEITVEDMQPLYSHSRLIRTEMFTLIGLMVRANPDYDAPPPDDVEAVALRAEMLMSELHDSMKQSWIDSITSRISAGESPNLRMSGDEMREPIFYSGDGAFSFQTAAFAAAKYANDDAWITAQKGASINEMIAVAKAILAVQTRKVTDAIHSGAKAFSDRRILEAFMFNVSDLEPLLNLTPTTIVSCIDAFALPRGHGNPSFKELHDLNWVNALPILDLGDGRYLLFHFNALAEALYESPFYWLGADKSYATTALKNRGDFTEEFAFSRLIAVFGSENVYRGVNIERKKSVRLGEIDVLVLFGDRAIVLQAKSKRMTLESRRGNDLQIKDDFKAAVQDSYNQAMDCAKFLRDPTCRFLASNGAEIAIPTALSQIFPICLVADHYPALALQTREFLVLREENTVLAPLIIDIFSLDVMAEMMMRPLRFISYLELRALHGSKISIHHEITLLSYHFRHNLWLDDEYDMVALDDDFAADLEIAMGARRLGLPGKQTPDGILNAIEGRKLDDLIKAFEADPSDIKIDIALLIYQMSGEAIRTLADGIDKILDNARKGRSSDFSLGFSDSGLTLHSNHLSGVEADSQLLSHMKRRKYGVRAGSWYGLSLAPTDGAIRFCRKIASPWKFDAATNQEWKKLGQPEKPRPFKRDADKLGRNQLCHCGSGKKYKVCHMNSDSGIGSLLAGTT
jgi:hypothetical protein